MIRITLLDTGAIDEIKAALKNFKMKKDFRTALDERMKSLEIAKTSSHRE
jgi:hypothetical protein